MAISEERAVNMIYYAAEQRINNELRYAEFFKTSFKYYLSNINWQHVNCMNTILFKEIGGY